MRYFPRHGAGQTISWNHWTCAHESPSVHQEAPAQSSLKMWMKKKHHFHCDFCSCTHTCKSFCLLNRCLLRTALDWHLPHIPIMLHWCQSHTNCVLFVMSIFWEAIYALTEHRSRETTGNKENWDLRWGCFHGCQLKALNHQSTPSLSFLYW